MELQEQITHLRYLEQEYLKHKYIKNNENSLESIRTFAAWHSAAAVLFCDIIPEGDSYLKRFVEADTSGNAYVLASLYDSLHTSYEVLMNRVQKNGKSIEQSSTSSNPSPLVFISHSSKDAPIIKNFIRDILKNGIGLRNEEIACTSFEATGVSPGESIPKYIKDNIKGAKICLAMVSKNYKASEVCQNEVGAAWALGNVPIQVVLPNTEFKEIGWLLNTDKAAKIDDDESLDSLMEQICNRIGRPYITPTNWNPCKKDFLKSLTAPQSVDTDTDVEIKSLKETKVAKESKLQVFDTLFRIRDITEGVFQAQIDLRLRTSENIYLRKISLVNKEDFIGSSYNGRNDMDLRSFLQYQLLDIDTCTLDSFEEKLRELDSSSMRVLDYYIDKDHQISLSIVSSFCVIREMDGYMDLPISGWSLKIEYNVSDSVSVPLEIKLAKGAENRYFVHRL